MQRFFLEHSGFPYPDSNGHLSGLQEGQWKLLCVRVLPPATFSASDLDKVVVVIREWSLGETAALKALSSVHLQYRRCR